ncbi:uncharacterized protein SRS1_17065 [Sporisorium reilianum f. sp. reilianum]|uniref:Uncharacterized protein n=1 Tax=Sporisorium reilianum f. sp. reilianum TaxID=72559 RepID=A0A2N8U879_9BASI|nr:uncharacterized protein SRS1_17065 [Sporisorium reilianum f. sp. reilianum]
MSVAFLSLLCSSSSSSSPPHPQLSDRRSDSRVCASALPLSRSSALYLNIGCDATTSLWLALPLYSLCIYAVAHFDPSQDPLSAATIFSSRRFCSILDNSPPLLALFLPTITSYTSEHLPRLFTSSSPSPFASNFLKLLSFLLRPNHPALDPTCLPPDSPLLRLEPTSWRHEAWRLHRLLPSPPRSFPLQPVSRTDAPDRSQSPTLVIHPFSCI